MRHLKELKVQFDRFLVLYELQGNDIHIHHVIELDYWKEVDYSADDFYNELINEIKEYECV